MVLLPLLGKEKALSGRALFANSVAIILPLCMVSVAASALRGTLPLFEALPYCIGGSIGGIVGGKFSSRAQVSFLAMCGIALLLAAMFVPVRMVTIFGKEFPLSMAFMVAVGLCTSVMWGGIFNLAVEGLGKYTEQASGIFMMMVVGGGVMPFIQDWIARATGYMASYWLVIAMLGFIFYYAVAGCKNVNKDIPVE